MAGRPGTAARDRLTDALGFLWLSILRGGLRTLHEVATFGDGPTLDAPGSPGVILTPGHTPSSAALHVPSVNALFVGDTFATYAVTTGARGHQVAPFTKDSTQAVASLSRLEGIPRTSCLLGTATLGLGGIQEAIEHIRQTVGS